ncbi:L,D-transpeptidase family protein [Leptolyngbya sp. 'hensonii']|uniref:L,D-transpeptidase family protein n=1 Tax=Leptolyngbya sp. 'hensonii' TaxID=1922337 RepID=UPI0009F81957
MWLCLGSAALIILSRHSVSSLEVSQPPRATPVSPRFHRIVPKESGPSREKPIVQPLPAQLPILSHVVVDLSDRRVYLYRAEKLQSSYPVAVGQAGWETPPGNFKITQMKRDPVWTHPITGVIVSPGPENPLGSRWIGFLTEGKHAIGFHGTNQDRSVGKAVSHGCLRMRNRDIMALYDRVAVGTPVTVKP